jgi:hypothetical protein
MAISLTLFYGSPNAHNSAAASAGRSAEPHASYSLIIDGQELDKEAKAMTRSSRRIGRTKAIAGALAMIADAFPESTPRESDELLWESAVEFCAAMDRYKRGARGGSRMVRE